MHVSGPAPQVTDPRRSRVRAVLGWVLVYVAIAAAALGANPLRGETVGPFDLLGSYPGWNPGLAVAEVRHAERSDVLDFFLPTWIEARTQLHEGHLPLWNPLRAGGAPALFDPINALLTPPFAIFAMVPDPATGFYLAILFCLVTCGLGMHFLARRYCGHAASLFAGVTFMLSGFVTAWLFWPHVFTAMWIPWLLLAVDRYIDRKTFVAVVPIALATALMFLGGFPFVVAIGMGAVLTWAVVKSVAEQFSDVVPNVFGVAAGMALGLALVAIPLLGLVDTLRSVDISYRNFGSPLNFRDHVELLSRPWAQKEPHVESNMYVGMCALAAALLGLFAIGGRSRQRTLAWIGIAFAASGALLTFGLLPREIGAHIPVLSNNAWNRCILLLDLGLILLAAVGVDRLQLRLRPRMVAIATLAALVSIQAIDLGEHFRRFNGPTPKALFFPVSSELASLKRQVRPFQYVGQDSASYVLSGTLGAAGLAEWYAHSLRSEPLRVMLGRMAQDPFTTPTATQINLDRYRWDSNLLDAAGLCYAVSTGMQRRWPVLVQPAGKQKVALPAINGALVRQPVEIPAAAGIPALAVRLAIYGQDRVDGDVRVRLYDPAADRPLGDWLQLPASRVRDNQLVLFQYPAPLEVAAGKYELQLQYSPGPMARKLTAWTLVDQGGQLHVDATPHVGALDHIVYHDRSAGSVLVPIVASDQVLVAENPGCARGPYFVASSMPVEPRKWPDATRLHSYLPHRFEIAVDAPASGYVVVPMRYSNGWSAKVDGRPVSMRLVEGVMPAIPVSAGRSLIAVAYRPPLLLAGVLISLVALLVAGLATWLSRSRGKGSGGTGSTGMQPPSRYHSPAAPVPSA